MGMRSCLLLLLLASPALQAQWFDWSSPVVPRNADGSPDRTAPAPRAADGHPDISGVWLPTDTRGTLFDTSKIQDWAIDRMAAEEQSFYANDPRFHCLPSGPGAYPAGSSSGGLRRIVHHPEFIAILNPDLTYRQVFLDGRALEAEPLLSTWLGFAAGHWEGDTLVIESNGYNAKTWLTREGLPHTDQLRITERYTRRDYWNMDLEITYVDPGTFTEPVQATMTLVNQPDQGMLEVVCNESTTGQQHYSGEISQSEGDLVTVPLETLQQYTGTYTGTWLGRPISVVVTVEDGKLIMLRTPPYSDTGGNSPDARYSLIAQSETAFDCTCGLGFVFTLGADGKASEVKEVHVSGAWTFKRVP
jgi:hypothetical protein